MGVLGGAKGNLPDSHYMNIWLSYFECKLSQRWYTMAYIFAGAASTSIQTLPLDSTGSPPDASLSQRSSSQWLPPRPHRGSSAPALHSSVHPLAEPVRQFEDCFQQVECQGPGDRSFPRVDLSWPSRAVAEEVSSSTYRVTRMRAPVLRY